MKEKLQKYLAGEREGFSLVELIIVIAIMAILVGVVALAVLPNIEKSKESKDFATLDAICSALNGAVATTQASGSATFEVPTASVASPASEEDKVKNAVVENLGSGAKTLTCTAAKGMKIICHYDTGSNVIEVYAAADTSTTTGIQSKYNGEMKVSNGGTVAASAAP